MLRFSGFIDVLSFRPEPFSQHCMLWPCNSTNWVVYRTETRDRSGAVLLEALIAMTILAIAGLLLVSMASQSAESLRLAQEREREFRAANAFLDAVSLWPTQDLDRHLGTRPQGPWRMFVARPSATLYVVTLQDSLGGYTILETSLYRAKQQDHAR
jgi:hypothetical protein